jgi:hypothetical protein
MAAELRSGFNPHGDVILPHIIIAPSTQSKVHIGSQRIRTTVAKQGNQGTISEATTTTKLDDGDRA